LSARLGFALPGLIPVGIDLAGASRLFLCGRPLLLGRLRALLGLLAALLRLSLALLGLLLGCLRLLRLALGFGLVAFGSLQSPVGLGVACPCLQAGGARLPFAPLPQQEEREQREEDHSEDYQHDPDGIHGAIRMPGTARGKHSGRFHLDLPGTRLQVPEGPGRMPRGSEGDMPLPDIDTALDWRGRDVIDRNGEKIGKFEELYLDEETSRPEWAAVATGLFGRKQTLIPLSEARLEGDALQVPFEQDQVKDAPALDPDESLSQDEERQLYSHYGMEYSTSGSETVLPEAGREGGGEASEAGEAGRTEQADARSGRAEEAAGQPEAGTGQPEAGTGQDEQPAAGGETPSGESDRSAAPPSAAPSSPTTAAGEEASATGAPGSAGGEGTTGEGGLRVGTEVTPRERVRLKKYVVTEEVTKKVPVTREEVRVEREPVGEGESGAGEAAEGEEQVVLSEEEPVIREPEQAPEQREEQ
jgi:hypothetical protein